MSSFVRFPSGHILSSAVSFKIVPIFSVRRTRDLIVSAGADAEASQTPSFQLRNDVVVDVRYHMTIIGEDVSTCIEEIEEVYTVVSSREELLTGPTYAQLVSKLKTGEKFHDAVMKRVRKITQLHGLYRDATNAPTGADILPVNPLLSDSSAISESITPAECQAEIVARTNELRAGISKIGLVANASDGDIVGIYSLMEWLAKNEIDFDPVVLQNELAIMPSIEVVTTQSAVNANTLPTDASEFNDDDDALDQAEVA